MKKLLLLFILPLVFYSCKKDNLSDKKYKVTYTFDSGASVADKYYILNDSERATNVGNGSGVHSMDVNVSIGDKISAVIQYNTEIKGPHEISIMYNGNLIGYTENEKKIGVNNSVIQIIKTFSKADFK